MPIQQMLLGSGGAGEAEPWHTVFGRNYDNDTTASNIRLDSQRNIIVVTGETYSLKVVKIKNDGSILWVKYIAQTAGSYGINAGMYRQGLAIDSSDNIYITDKIGYNYQSHDGLQEGDLVIIKLNSSGVLQWQKGIITSYQGNSYGWGSYVGGVETDPSGNVYVTGAAYHSSKSRKPFLIKFNSSGTVQWQRELVQGSATSGCRGSCLLYVPASSAYTDATGTSIPAQNAGILLYGHGNFDNVFTAYSTCFIAKFDLNGNYDWCRMYYQMHENHYTSEYLDTCQLLTRNPNTGDIFMSGETRSGIYTSNAFTARLAADGRDLGWHRKFGYTQHINTAIAYDPTNNYIIAVGQRNTNPNSGQYHIRNAANGTIIGKGFLSGESSGTFNYTQYQKHLNLSSVVCDNKGHFYLLGNVQNYSAPNSSRNVVVWKLISKQNTPYTTNQSYIGYNVNNWLGTGWSHPGSSSYHHNARFALSNGHANGYPNNNPPDVNYSSFNSDEITSYSTRFTSSSSSLSIVTSQFSASNSGNFQYQVKYDWPA